MSQILNVGEVDIEDTNYLTIVNVMTYREDGDILYWSMRSVLAVLGKYELEVYIMDDDNNPMTEEQVSRVIALDPRIHYERTTFERNRNLNGRSCCIGMLEKFVEHAAGRDCLNMKLDPDTILTRRRIYNEFWNFKNTAYCASSRPGCYFSGVMYIWKSDAAPKALELMKSDYLNHVPTDKGPEDYIIGILLSVASLPRLSTLIRSWDNDAKKGYSAAWPFSTPKEHYEQMADLYVQIYDFVTMGNWFVHRDKGITKEDRLVPAQMIVERIEAKNGISR